MSENFGEDVFNFLKVLDVFLILVAMAFLAFVTVNIPEDFQMALIYIIFGSIYLFALLLDSVIKREEMINTVGYEKPETRPFGLGFIPNKVLVIVAIIFGIIILYQTSNLGFAMVDAPRFQAVPFAAAPEYSSLLDGIAGLIEGRFFFCFIFPTIFIIFNKYLKIPWYGAILGALILIGLIFGGYHWWVYGSDIAALNTTIMFGGFNALLIYLFRFPLLIDSWHVFNNIGLTYFRTAGVSFWILILDFFPIILVGGILITAYLMARRRFG